MHPALLVLKPIGAWVLKNIVPIAAFALLAFSHLWAYRSGVETTEQKHEQAVLEAMVENEKLRKATVELAIKRAEATAERVAESRVKRNAQATEAKKYVAENPVDPICLFTDTDVSVLNAVGKD